MSASGETRTGLISDDELLDLLASDDGGFIHEGRKAKAPGILRQLRLDGLPREVVGERPCFNVTAISSFRLVTREDPRLVEYERQAWDEPKPSQQRASEQTVLTTPVYGCHVEDLLKFRPRLIDAGFWSKWLDKRFGATDESKPVSAPTPAATARTVQPLETAMPKKKFIERYGHHYTGKTSIADHVKHRFANDRARPYADALNAGGAINAVKFEEIARQRGEWTDSDRTAAEKVFWSGSSSR